MGRLHHLSSVRVLGSPAVTDQSDTAAMRALAADWTQDTGTLRNALEEAAEALDAIHAEYVEAMQLWTDQIADSNNLHQRLLEEIARATRAEDALRTILIATGHRCHEEPK